MRFAKNKVPPMLAIVTVQLRLGKAV